MSRLFTIPLFSLAALLLSSCFENSTVIKINRDGSGLVHERTYSSTQVTEEDVTLPERDSLEARAKSLGPGVRVQSVNKAKNSKGWFGHEVIYEFDDVNKLTFRTEEKQDKEDQDADQDTSLDSLAASFTLKDGVVEVALHHPDWDNPRPDPDDASSAPTIDPYAGTSGPRAAKPSLATGLGGDEMMRAMSKGMRVGMFVQLEGGVGETNARFRNGELVTLFHADFEKLCKDGEPNFSMLENVPRDQLAEQIEKVDGLEMDLQNPIRIRFK
jgi:hypothetical protein